MTPVLPALLWVLSLFAAATAQAQVGLPPLPPLGAKAYILIDHHSGQVLASQAASERLDPASITKLMTAYAVFRAIRDGRIGLEDEALVSEAAWRTGGSRTFIDVNTRVPVSVLLKGMIIQSGNDASVALAEHVAGTEAAFAGLMTQYAAELGMNDTRYLNATGLSEPGHYTTAADIATLGRAIIHEFPEYYRWYSEKEFRWNGITQGNRNGLLYRDPSVDGMKTGYTETAGYCLVSSALRDGMRLIAVVLGTDSPRAREQDSATLLNHGFRNWESRRILTAGESIGEYTVWKGERDQVGIGVSRDVWVALPRGGGAIEQDIDIREPLMAPLDPAVALGTVRVQLGSEVLTEAPVHALTTVASGSLLQQALDTVLLWFE